MEAVDGAGPLVDQVVVAFGQQPQDGGLVLASDLAQVSAEEGDLRDVECVGRIGLAVPAGGEEPGPGRERRGHVHDVLAGGGLLLGARVRPRPPAPSIAKRRSGHWSHQRISWPKVPASTTNRGLAGLVAGGVDGDCGV